MSPSKANKRKADQLSPQASPPTKAPNTNQPPLPDLSTLSFSSNDDSTMTSPTNSNQPQPPSSANPDTSTLPNPTENFNRALPPHLAPAPGNTGLAHQPAPNPHPFIPNQVRFTISPPNTQGDIHIPPSHIFEKWSKDDITKFYQSLTNYTILCHLADDWPGSDLNISRDVLHQLLGIAGGLDNPRTRFGGLDGVGKRNIKKDHTYCRWYYLTGLTKEQFDRLAGTRRVWNCDFGTMVTHPWPLPITGFATTISGLAARSVDLTEVNTAVKNAIYHSKPALDFIAEGKADRLKGHEGMAEELLFKIADSAYAIPRDPDTTSPTSAPTSWAVFTTPVTNKIEHWEEWLQIMAGIPIITDIGIGNSNGAPRVHCQICQSVDHTRSYCYYPKVDGWIDQVKLAEERPNQARRNEGGNRGGRTNGRGSQWGIRSRGRPY